MKQRAKIERGLTPNVPRKGSLSNKTARALVFKLVEAAQKSWHRLDAHALLPKIIMGVKFTDGIEAAAEKPAPQTQAAAA